MKEEISKPNKGKEAEPKKIKKKRMPIPLSVKEEGLLPCSIINKSKANKRI